MFPIDKKHFTMYTPPVTLQVFVHTARQNKYMKCQKYTEYALIISNTFLHQNGHLGSTNRHFYVHNPISYRMELQTLLHESQSF